MIVAAVSRGQADELAAVQIRRRRQCDPLDRALGRRAAPCVIGLSDRVIDKNRSLVIFILMKQLP